MAANLIRFGWTANLRHKIQRTSANDRCRGTGRVRELSAKRRVCESTIARQRRSPSPSTPSAPPRRRRCKQSLGDPFNRCNPGYCRSEWWTKLHVEEENSTPIESKVNTKHTQRMVQAQPYPKNTDTRHRSSRLDTARCVESIPGCRLGNKQLRRLSEQS
eukprot:818064-Rhodomonas_salina.3